MNFKLVLNRFYSNSEILSLLRILNGISLLIYYTLALAPNWSEFFSSYGFISPESFRFFPDSWLFGIWQYDTLKLWLFGFTFFLIFLYTVGFFTKIVMLLLVPLHIGFHLANPMIIHEPQQLSNLLMVLLFMLPIDKTWSLKSGPDLWKDLSNKNIYRILNVMLLYLGIYYFFAGLKKLPDSNWISGDAVRLLASWPSLALNNYFNEFVQNSIVSKISSWFTILFELSFVFMAFASRRRFLIVSGLIFHLGISLTLDVGLFFWAMIQWYPLLLISKSAENPDSLSSISDHPEKNASG